MAASGTGESNAADARPAVRAATSAASNASGAVAHADAGRSSAPMASQKALTEAP